MDRYQRQFQLPRIGRAGQQKLAAARVLLVGCGALGTVLADQLVRAGVGHLRIVDRDLVELSNLQRQVLFDEADARQQLPKAIAASTRLRAINSDVVVEPIVADLHAGNVEELAGLNPGNGARCDLILDGTDSVETRYLLNDVSVKYAAPWIYGACVATEGRMRAFVPPATACLRCLFPRPPAPGELPTCDTAGILAPVSAMVASLQAMAALKLLIGGRESVSDELITLDAWRGEFRAMDAAGSKRDDCVACGKRVFEFLDRRHAGTSTALCGRNAVQIRPPAATRLDLNSAAERLSQAGEVERTPYLVRCRLRADEQLTMTLFGDGRLIVQGTADAARAKSLYARFVGV